ncbi:phage tail sheath subtilisin-like domain-containing protein [Lysobacter brunescens]|uniref:Phage tail sheath subtilisin-like domain-containing protein n=1 Tax=Lysobacter brunescens TaxID=262323 RepID=A0ABW2YF36_9GAMM
MSAPFHGINIVESSVGARPASRAPNAVIYLVATGDDADADTFPANDQVLITNVRAAVGAAGTTGTLRGALLAIADQCEPLVIVMRVPAGEDAAATAANTIGSSSGATYTGLQGARVSRQRFGLVPKIIGAPGLETQAVIAAMVSVAQAVRGMCYANAEGATKEEAATFRDNFDARELVLLWPNVVRFDTVEEDNVEAPASAYALGMRAKIDATMGWHKTLSNVAINGILGLAQDVSFDILSGANDAGYLNTNDVCAVIHSNGYRFWGNRTTSDDAAFAFESATRTAQVLHEDAADVLAAYIDKPMGVQSIRDMTESMNARARARVALGQLIGARYFIDPALNQPNQLAAGQLRISCTYTAVPPMESITVDQAITDEFFFQFAQAIAA